MRYMFLISAAETGAQPPASLGEAMEKLAAEETAAGRMIARGGLMPTAMGAARLESKRGKLKVVDGPFTESKEVLGGFAIFELATRQEALASAERFLALHREHWPEFECVCEIRPMFGMDGMGCAGFEADAELLHA
ncbi:MAG TPA: YciI family protein [Candidatus Binatia bacterium]|nr:YciI family protein [Candidatus Binatia bacterium]